MADINALMGMGIEDEELLREMSEQLRGRKEAADFFAATTVPSIRRAAEREQNNITGAAKQAGVLKKSLLDRQSMEKRASEYGGSRASRYFNVQPVRLDNGRVVMFGTNPQTNQFEQIPGLPEGARVEPLSEYGAGRMNQKVLDNLNVMSRLATSINNADSQIAQYAIGGEEETPWNDIPGMGRFSGKPGVLGKGARLAEEFISGEGSAPSDVFASTEAVRHILVQEAAGLTQSIQEMAAQQNIAGRDLFTNPDTFRKNYNWIKQRVHEHFQRQKASLPAGAYQEWRNGFSGTEGIDPMEWQPNYMQFPGTESEGLSDLMPEQKAMDNINSHARSDGWTVEMIERQRRIDELKALQEEGNDGTYP